MYVSYTLHDYITCYLVISKIHCFSKLIALIATIQLYTNEICQICFQIYLRLVYFTQLDFKPIVSLKGIFISSLFTFIRGNLMNLL